MKYAQFSNQIRKIFALLAVILVLPALTPSSHGGQNNQGQNYPSAPEANTGIVLMNYPSAPEANTGIVLIPFVGAVLVFSAFQLLRAKTAQKKDS
jgi:hypothetical protein